MICEGRIFLGCSLGIELECGEMKFCSFQNKTEVHIQRNQWNPHCLYHENHVSLSNVHDLLRRKFIFHLINSLSVTKPIGRRA